MNAATAPAADAAAILDDPLELARFSRATVGPDGERRMESALQVSGMTCAACAGLIEQALMRSDGVLAASVSAAGERATVRWDPQRTQPSRLIEAIRAAGYDAVPDAAAPGRALRQKAQRQALWRLFVAGFCMMQVMMLATPGYVAAPGEMAPDLQQLLNWGQWVLTLPVVAFSAGPFFEGAWRALRAGRIGMDVPVALGIVVTFVASTGAAFDPAGAFGDEVYFDSLTMFVSFLLGARWLELRARHRATDTLERTLAGMPQTALRLDADGAQSRVSVQRLAVGDRVRVPVGEAFAADGVLIEGPTQVDEALLTGESTPVTRSAGEAVVGGSVNVGAPVVMRVERVGADSRFEAIVGMMRDAMTQRPAASRLADRWAAPFLWTVIVLAAGSAAVWSVIDPSRAIWVAVSVLIVTCPCALSLAAPSVLVAAAGGLARRGVLVQRLDAIERLARADRLFVDKTGTLTDDRPALTAVRPLAGFDEAEVRRRAAGLAQGSIHPLSAALADVAAPSTDWRQREEHPGRGLSGVDGEGRHWRLGSAAWTGAEALGDARVWLARDGQVVAAFDVDESLRDGAAEAIESLRAGGLAIGLLSGDVAPRAEALADRLGIGEVHAGASPEEKLEAVRDAQARGEVVMMVGDGVNDAPVLARADVSLAMGQGALVSKAQADAVVISGRWHDIVRARRSARRAMQLVRQNMIWAAAYNASCIPLAMAGLLPPWAAGLGMALSSLAVVANALRASR